MTERIEVVYENGVFRPVGPVPQALHEHQRLTVHFEAVEDTEDWQADADPDVSLEAVRQALAKVPGTLAEMIHEEREGR